MLEKGKGNRYVLFPLSKSTAVPRLPDLSSELPSVLVSRLLQLGRSRICTGPFLRLLIRPRSDQAGTYTLLPFRFAVADVRIVAAHIAVADTLVAAHTAAPDMLVPEMSLDSVDRPPALPTSAVVLPVHPCC